MEVCRKLTYNSISAPRYRSFAGCVLHRRTSSSHQHGVVFSQDSIIYEHWKASARSGESWQSVSSRNAFRRCTKHDGTNEWKKVDHEPLAKSREKPQRESSVKTQLLTHFLPVGYPASVSPCYGNYAFNTFIASIAGSASMVLSTQSLLLAIGVVGMHSTQAGILAGAINWVLKDGLSQAGAILWTSLSARNYDDHPKMWRMVAAITLDVAAGIELISPFLTETKGAVLAAACAAGTLKNVGFLTASASRAALHQALSQDGRNLADVTAKAGSQSIVAGLVGTALGIGASNVLQGKPDVLLSYGICFIGLASVHQLFNYYALKSVAFDSLDRHRAQMVLDRFMRDGQIMDPTLVAEQEPVLNQLTSQGGDLRIGVGVAFHSSSVIHENSKYLISQEKGSVFLTFMKDASPEDQLEALYHALLLSKGRSEDRPPPGISKRLTDAGWDVQRTNIEPRGECVRLSVGTKEILL